VTVLRMLPAAAPSWRRDADVVVVGAGAAGMTAALTAAGRGRRVLLVCKDGLGGGCTALAQGGMAAAGGPGDSAALHAEDTAAAGAGLCDPAAVSILAAGAPCVLGWLASLGARLDPGHLEGGHSRPRIAHAGGDAAGAEVHRALAAAVAASPVCVLSPAVALDLADGGLLVGLGEPCAGRPGPPGALRAGVVHARAVVLATGGFGQAFAATTNPPGITGDGLALAARAGAVLQDMEFVQFHPTVLCVPGPGGQRPLVTEALRGAGAVLRDRAGRPLMAGRHPLGDLAPRDVVAAAMHEAGGGGPLWLDARALGRPRLAREFPTVVAACRAHGIDPAADLIPVAPGAHYACGGIRADMCGRTSLPGVYAVGEVACTGAHGANRLASNSLTEAMITGRRVGELLGADAAAGPDRAGTTSRGAGGDRLSGTWHRAAGAAGPACVAPSARAGLAAAMARHAGVLRDPDGLEELLDTLALAPGPGGADPAPGPGGVHPAPGPGALDLAAVEATNLHTVSVLVAAAAAFRRESRGCHRRRDAGGPDPGLDGRHTLLRWSGEGLQLWLTQGRAV
jgi:L-aspartate oxidase